MDCNEFIDCPYYGPRSIAAVTDHALAASPA